MTSDQDSQTASREMWPGTLLTLLCPGLGYMYVGQIGRGLLVNVAFVAGLAGFVGLVTALEFFPLLPLIVLLVAWLAMTLAVLGDVRSSVESHGDDYELESYNHWTIYGGTFLLTYVLPLTAVVVLTHTFLWDVASVESTAMYPNLEQGDSVLVRKDAYADAPPEPGDLVALDFPGSPGFQLRRVVAGPDQSIRMFGQSLYVDGQPLPKGRFPTDGDSGAESAAANGTDELRLVVEQNGNRKYAVALNPAAELGTGFDRRSLGSNEYFVLADNRARVATSEESASKESDDRAFAPIQRNVIAGRPVFVAWSASPSSSRIRWDRIGYRLQ